MYGRSDGSDVIANTKISGIDRFQILLPMVLRALTSGVRSSANKKNWICPAMNLVDAE